MAELLDSHDIDTEEALRLHELIANFSTSCRLIIQLMRALRQYSGKDSEQNTRTRAALRCLAAFTSAIGPTLLKHDAVCLLYGSTQYNDPINLDYDLLVVTSRRDRKMIRNVTYSWSDLIREMWAGWHIGSEGHIDYDSVADIENLRLNAYGLDSPSIILTGLTIAGSKELAQSFRKRILRLSLSNPLIAALTVANLEDCLGERLERRKAKRLSMAGIDNG